MIEFEIKDSLKDKGCIICNLVKKRMDERMWWFERENYHDATTLENLNKFPYICERHKKELIKIGNILSVTFEFLVKKDIELLSLASANTSTKKLKKKIDKTCIDECKFCKEERDIEKFIVKSFMDALKNEKIRRLYEKSDGLCRRHLFQCLLFAEKDSEEILFLANDTLTRLKKLKSSFETFFHKSDYRFSNETKGEEQNAWLDALHFYSDNKK